MTSHYGHVTTIAFSDVTPSGIFLVSGSNDHSIAVWKLQAGSLTLHAVDKKPHDAVVSSVTFGRGECKEMFFSGCWNGVIKAWKSGHGNVLGPGALISLSSIYAHPTRISSLATTVNGKVLVSSCGGGSATTWTIAPTGILTPLSAYANINESIISSVALERTFVTGSETGTLRLWPILQEDGTYKELFEHTKRQTNLLK